MGWFLFGPVRALLDGREIDLGPAKQRCVVAALLFTPAQPVALATLVDRVWDDRPPRGTNPVAPYASRLRRALAGCDAELRFEAGGYRLDCEPAGVDLHRARRLAGQATAAHRAGDHGRAAGLWQDALAVAQGEPLTGLPGRWAGQMRDTLYRERLGWHARLAECELELGRCDAVVDRLDPLVAELPAAEELVGPLMSALHAAGRTAQALDRYARARAAIADELGTEPSPRLRELHAHLLRADGGRAVTPRPAPAPPRPAQLPPAPVAFTGRAAELVTLDEIRGEGETRVIVISGTPGVGKTALAVLWAHRVQACFPDGQIYLNLHGFDPGLTVPVAEALRHLLTAVGVPGRDVPADPDAGVALMRSRFAGRRALIVLDDARDADQVRPLLPGGHGCLVLVTSRRRLAGLVASHGAYPVDLGVLTAAEARELLARRIAGRRQAAGRPEVEALAAAGAGLPLALVTIAARVATEPDRPLAAFAAELAGSGHALDALDAGDAATDVRTVFFWSYRALSPPAARLFRLLGAHPGPDIGAAAAARLAGLPAERVTGPLSELATACLVTTDGGDRYGLHDLLRAYAGELGDEPERRGAMRRVLDHYLYTADAAADAVAPARGRIELDPAPVPVARFAGGPAALAWFGAEHAVLMAAVRRAAETGLYRHAWQLAATMADYLELRGHWADWIAITGTGLAAAGRAGDPRAQARLHRVLGRAYVRIGRPDRAEPHYRQALLRYAEAGDPAGRADTHFSLSFMCEEQGRHHQAMRHSEQALRLYRLAGHEVGQARALNALGWDHATIGDYRATLRYCTEALALQQRLGDAYGQAAAWDSLGYAHHHLGDPRTAVRHYRRSLQLYRRAGDLYNEADVLIHLGESHLALGDRNAARAHWARAYRLLQDLDHPGAAAVAERLERMTA